ncbi:MAG: ABC transporter permease [Oscillospiraceae bacterium]|nr:ABC transporter permease [Oscillospiraceae bacterium]
MSILNKVGKYLAKNNVTVLFVILCLLAYHYSTFTLPTLFEELFIRIGRNTFLVLSLLIPIIAGLGLNFGIVIGAIAAQIAIFVVVLFGGSGFTGILWAVAICTPLAVFFGYLVGSLFNKMKGTEMIGGLVAGFFSDGIYQFIFLFMLGGVIVVNAPDLMIATGVGVRNIINLDGNLRQAIDNMPMINIIDAAFYAITAICAILIIFRLAKKRDLQIKKLLKAFLPVAILWAASWIPAVGAFMSAPRLLLLYAIEFGVAGAVIYQLWKIFASKVLDKNPELPKMRLVYMGVAGGVYAITFIPAMYEALSMVNLPVLTYLIIAALYMFIPWFMNTKLGQDMRTVGQDRAVATSSGINVNKVRIIAMIMSTVLASYGQIISLQNIGTVATYGSHIAVGLYSIAALLVGGASVQRATTKQAVLGIVLFHTMFILSANAGAQLLGNAQIGEFFRVFAAYGVIAVALAMHAWSRRKGGQTLGLPAATVVVPAKPPESGSK